MIGDSSDRCEMCNLRDGREVEAPDGSILTMCDSCAIGWDCWPVDAETVEVEVDE